MVFGLAQSSSYHGFGNLHVLVPLIAGALLLAAFCVNALRIPHALIDLRLFAKRGFASASASMFASGFVLFGAMGALPLYYQLARGDSAEHAGRSAHPAGRRHGCVPAHRRAALGQDCTAHHCPGRAGVHDGRNLRLHPAVAGHQRPAAQRGPGVRRHRRRCCPGADHGRRLPRDAACRCSRASTSIRIMQQLGGSFGSAALFIIVQHQLTLHPHTAAGLAAAFSTTFWWVSPSPARC